VTTGKQLLASLKDNDIELVLDIRANRPVKPKTNAPSSDSHKGIHKQIYEARIGYRWVVALANDFGHQKKSYEEWLQGYSAHTLLKGIARNITQDNICLLCDEQQIREQVAIALQVELNKINEGWEIKNL